jgi:hypothetical protein
LREVGDEIIIAAARAGVAVEIDGRRHAPNAGQQHGIKAG